MDIDAAVALTQDRLAEEGCSMKDLLKHFRDKISPLLVGDAQWQCVLDCAEKLPITMGAFPFGFELPIHLVSPVADFGVSLTSGTKAAEYFEQRARIDTSNEIANVITRLFENMDDEDASLREIVGRKLMLEYDIGSAGGRSSFPGMFLRPGERPIIGAQDQTKDIDTVLQGLLSSLGWEFGVRQRNVIEQVYQAQPLDTRMDSFGAFPSRSRAIRLAIMGFKSRRELGNYLANVNWPGQLATVDSVISRIEKHVHHTRFGVNIDVEEDGVGPTLGLTLIVKQRYTNRSRYWLDGPTDWNPFLEALDDEELVIPEKLGQLAGWVTPPTMLFGKAARYMLVRGIHHLKLVVSEGELNKVKAYVFMILSGADFD